VYVCAPRQGCVSRQRLTGREAGREGGENNLREERNGALETGTIIATILLTRPNQSNTELNRGREVKITCDRKGRGLETRNHNRYDVAYTSRQSNRELNT
jgi:hypothetical protein